MKSLRLCGLLPLVLVCSSQLAQLSVRSAEALPPPLCPLADAKAETKTASIRADKAYMRAGPSRNHRVVWVFERRGLPVVVLYEHGNWSHVRDWEGETGWIHSALLYDRPTTLVVREEGAALRVGPSSLHHQIALLEKGVIGELIRCQRWWCKLVLPASEYPALARSLQGWVLKSELWGV